jgi:hypothetical protein
VPANTQFVAIPSRGGPARPTVHASQLVNPTGPTTMHPLKTIAPAQQLTALALSALLTVLLLFSLGAEADTQHADAMASAQGSGQQLCAAPQQAART